jgi:hypothetical protein
MTTKKYIFFGNGRAPPGGKRAPGCPLVRQGYSSLAEILIKSR